MTVRVLDINSKYQLHPTEYEFIRALAIDSARTKLEVAGVADLTDSTTGTAGSAFSNPVVPSAAYNAVSSGGATLTAVNTAFGKFENACKVLVNSFNNARSRIGRGMMSAATGTQASANVLPAQDLTVAATSGTAAVDYASAKAAMIVAKNNLGKVFAGFNEIRRALGEPDISQTLYHGAFTDRALLDVPTVAAAATGASSVSATAMNTFLQALADNLATVAKYWNYMFTQGSFTAITDSSGGSAAAGLVANVAPTAAAGAATTSSPKAGFDTELNVIENAIAEVATKMNSVRAFYDLAVYTDSTGQTANGTVEALSVNLTAVDGSSGTVAVDVTTALARMATIRNSLSSLAVGINDLVGFVGVASLTDALGGTASTTLANIAATGGGVGGATPVTLLDTAVDTWLSTNRDNISTLVAKINAVMAQSQAAVKPLGVVAG